MKLCLWTVYPNTNTKALFDGLREAGADVAVCYYGTYDRGRLAMGWKERPLEPWEHRVRGLSDARRILPDFDSRVQMVPSFFNLTSWKVLLRCCLKGQPWFVVTEGTRGSRLMRPLFRLFCRFVDRRALRLFAEGGPRTQTQFTAAGVRREKVVPFAYATMPPPAGLEREAHEGTAFVYAGSFSVRKATDVLAAVWPRLHAEYPSARLILAGGGEMAGALTGLPGVEMMGAVRQEDVYSVIRRGDVMLQPSRYDPWGVALVEGARAGLAMVGSDRTGSAEALVEDGVNGFIVRAGDAEDLLRVMRLYAADRGLARTHGERAREAGDRTDGRALAERLLGSLSADLVAASFWEEHCTECGEPDCYRTCPNFVRGRGGRCRRFVGGLAETILGEGTEVRFLPWGKMEALFHGRMIVRSRAAELERLMRRTAWLRRIFPRGWRSWRWRWALRDAQPGRPNVWRCTVTAERDERLVFAAVGETELFRALVELKPGVRKSVELRLPEIGEGTLFRIFPANGEGTGRIRFERNELACLDRSPFVKCVAWDLDGTLWEGTLADDGPEGLRLNDGAVALVKELDGRGIVNSIASRNDAAPALAALRRFGLEEYFVFPQIGWGAKSEALRNLARELNIATDALAFVDDREEVRNEVRANLPEVAVFAASEIPVLASLPAFNPPRSAESAHRRMRYREEMTRRGALQHDFSGDAAAFLQASELSFELLPVEGDVVARCRELVQRTNQLNLTGRRYDDAAFRELLARSDCRAVQVRDRYGDYGIVGFTALAGTHLVECCFSCRVAEKGVERRVLERLAAGRKLTADVVVTPRNARMREIVGNFLQEGQ